MKQYTKLQLMDATKLPEEALNRVLLHCGVTSQQESFSQEEVAKLLSYVEYQQDSTTQKAQEKLARVVTPSTILVDTCSLLHYQFDTWVEHLLPLLRQRGQGIIVPSGVVQELLYLQTQKPNLEKAVARATKCLNQLQQEGLLSVYGSEQERFGDQQFLTVVTKFRTQNRLLVVTQDKALAEDLLQLNQLQSVQGKKVQVRRINSYGYLSCFHGDAKGNSCSYFPSGPLVTDTQQILPLSQQLTTGDIVTGAGGSLVLGDVLGRGGEGTIYDLGDGTVAKLYHPEKLTVTRMSKLQLMVTTPIQEEGICWPQELLYNQAGEFVGYRMLKAIGTSLQHCLLNQTNVQRYFPSGKKRELVELAVTLLGKLQVLHRAGVLMGDINLNNILMVSPKQVCLVDCDSYQVGGYPCPVGKAQFLPPELQGQQLSGLLRTQDNESFSVATLLFMLMLPGKAPYAQQGSESMEAAVREGNFPYPCGDNHGCGVPEGTWRYQWSHLPLYIKEYFYATFHRQGKFYAVKKRLPVSVWQSIFQRYLELLDSGEMEAKDEQSGRIYPNRMKQSGKTPRQVLQRRICQMCEEEFDLSQEEVAFFRTRGLYLPQTCPRCRQLKRALGLNVLDESQGAQRG